MPPVQQLDPEHCKQNQNNNCNKQCQIGAQSSVVVWLLGWLEKLGSDDVTRTSADKEDTSRYFTLRVASSILAGPGIDERRYSGVK